MWLSGGTVFLAEGTATAKIQMWNYAQCLPGTISYPALPKGSE